MEIAEVVDRESLGRYLDRLDPNLLRRTALYVTYRSAARVLPVNLQYFLHGRIHSRIKLSPLVLFGATAMPGIALTEPRGGHAPGALAVANAAAANAVANAAAAYTATAMEANVSAYAIAAVSNAEMTHSKDFWRNVRLDLVNAESIVPLPLWLGQEIPISILDAWKKCRQDLDLHKPEGSWRFWIEWYERVLAGRDTHADRLAPIFGGISKHEWLDAPFKVNALFEDVLAEYLEDDGAQDFDAANAAYFDFVEVNREMRAVAFSSDYEAFPHEEAKSAFLAAAQDLRLVFEDWCELARAQLQGRNRPVTAVVATEQILDQLNALERGEAVSLRNLVRLGSNVKRLARDKELPVDLGASVFEMFDEALEDYGQLVSVHLGGALQALMALRSLELGDLDSAECLDSLRGGLSYIQSLPTDVLLPFDAKSRAIIDHMVSDLEDEQSEIEEASTEVARQTRAKRFAEKFGGVSATIREYLLKGQMAAEKGGESVDKAGKWHKRWQTLEKIKEFWDNLPFGDGL